MGRKYCNRISQDVKVFLWSRCNVVMYFQTDSVHKSSINDLWRRFDFDLFKRCTHRMDPLIQDLHFQSDYFHQKTCRMYFTPPPPNCTYSRKNTSRSLLLILKSCQRMCHNYVFILSLQLEKKNLYFVFIWEKKRVHLLEVLCVYLNSHCNFFIYENIVAVSSFMLSVGQTFGCF